LTPCCAHRASSGVAEVSSRLKGTLTELTGTPARTCRGEEARH
jgi:hypothetical protein